MICKITDDNKEIEYYYNIGSIHGDIRMMLFKYVYEDIFFDQVIRYYKNKGNIVLNYRYDKIYNTLNVEITGSSLSFQENFAECMYEAVKDRYNSLYDLIDIFEKENPKYNELKESINILLNKDYYITLFRTSFIKHEKSTTCIIKL